jgi:hypothetical protein
MPNKLSVTLNNKTISIDVPPNLYDFKNEIINKFEGLTENLMKNAKIILNYSNECHIEINKEKDYQDFVIEDNYEEKNISITIPKDNVKQKNNKDQSKELEEINKLKNIYDNNQQKIKNIKKLIDQLQTQINFYENELSNNIIINNNNNYNNNKNINFNNNNNINRNYNNYNNNNINLNFNNNNNNINRNFNNNNNNINRNFDNFSNDFNIPNIPQNYYNNFVPVKECDKDFSCVYYENNVTINVSLDEIINKKKIIKYNFKIQNNGKKPWPDDSFLKCINDDSDIFFYYSKMNTNKVIWSDNVVYNEFEVIINFKNPIPRKGKYFCHAQLMSDTKGKMGNSIGTLFVNVN